MTKEAGNSYPVLVNFGHIHYDPKACQEPGVPVVTLSNGIRVANFSNPCSYEFIDGTILPGCSFARSGVLTVNKEEPEIETEIRGINVTDVLATTWVLAKFTKFELSRLSNIDGYDVLIVSKHIMKAMNMSNIALGRCRCPIKGERNKYLIDRFSLF